MTETIAIIGGIIGLLTAFIGFLIRLNRGMRRVMTMADDWNGEPARPGVPPRPGVLERLAAVEVLSQDIQHNVKPNSGHSAHDQVIRQLDAIQNSLDSFQTRMTLSEVDREHIHSEITQLAKHLKKESERREAGDK